MRETFFLLSALFLSCFCPSRPFFCRDSLFCLNLVLLSLQKGVEEGKECFFVYPGKKKNPRKKFSRSASDRVKEFGGAAPFFSEKE